jgi:hypothetical protein
MLQARITLARALVVGAVPVDRGGVAFRGDFLDHPLGRAAAQDETRSKCSQRGIERMKAVMQPPTRCRTGRANAVGLLIEHIDWHHRPARAEADDQRRIVG